MGAGDRVNWKQSVTAVRGVVPLVSSVRHIKSMGAFQRAREEEMMPRKNKMMEEPTGDTDS